MQAVPLILLVPIAVMLIAVLFAGWIIVTLARLVIRGLNALTAPRQQPRFIPSGWTCHQHRCNAVNPAHARFCRRCGKPAVIEQHVQVRRTVAA